MATAVFSSSLRATVVSAVGRGGGGVLRRRPALAGPPPTAALSSSWGALRCYSEEVHDHFRRPRNVGAFPADDPNVGTAVVGKAACGDVVKLQVKVEGGVICDAKFKTFGCGSAIASSSYATELIKGKSTEAALGISNREISDHLNLPPVKLHCSLLAEDAVRMAIRDYEEKKKGDAAAAAESPAAAKAEGGSGTHGGSGGGDAKKAAAVAAEEVIAL